MKKPKYKVGDLVKVKTTGSIRVQGKIWAITEGGHNLGFPWKDDTPHYEIIDEKTMLRVIAHERYVKQVLEEE